MTRHNAVEDCLKLEQLRKGYNLNRYTVYLSALETVNMIYQS